jgi:ribonuclease H2 subunit A
MARPKTKKTASANNTKLSDEAKAALAFIPPTINHAPLLHGQSYTVYSPLPDTITSTSDTHNEPTPCVLGVDEAGRGPVLGPMVYSAFYLPQHLEQPLLTDTHSFDDSKALTPAVRASLMHALCTPSTALHNSCGYAVKVLSARDIAAGMMRPGGGAYNLNAQAMDATIEIIQGVLEDRHVLVKEVYIDTIGNPATYQQKLARLFPTLSITVAKKADSLYPCVSAASVVAKVTRDVALDVCYDSFYRDDSDDTDMKDAPTEGEEREEKEEKEEETWGSGYPSDSKCVSWLRQNMDAVFGWGSECRFSWGTAKEMLEGKDAVRVDWPGEEEEAAGLADFLLSAPTPASAQAGKSDVSNWYGSRVGAVF